MADQTCLGKEKIKTACHTFQSPFSVEAISIGRDIVGVDLDASWPPSKAIKYWKG